MLSSTWVNSKVPCAVLSLFSGRLGAGQDNHQETEREDFWYSYFGNKNNTVTLGWFKVLPLTYSISTMKDKNLHRVRETQTKHPWHRFLIWFCHLTDAMGSSSYSMLENIVCLSVTSSSYSGKTLLYWAGEFQSRISDSPVWELLHTCKRCHITDRQKWDNCVAQVNKQLQLKENAVLFSLESH